MKKKSSSNKSPIDNLSINFSLGFSDPMSPEEYNSFRKKEFKRFDELYNTDTVKKINAIPVPETKISESCDSVTGMPEYILSLKSGRYEKEGKIDLALACLKKANELRYTSQNIYLEKDFYRYPKLLRKYRFFDEARAEEERINIFLTTDKRYVRNFYTEIESCLNINRALHYGDLVEISYHTACCEECAKYRGRVFSVYGKDKRFPKLPSNIPNCCNLWPYSYSYDFNEPQACQKKHIIRYSNRPFTDNRKPNEIIDYLEYRKQQDKAKDIKLREQDYNWLWEHLPEICPKSFSAYSRIKNADTDVYKEIVRIATEEGYIFKSKEKPPKENFTDSKCDKSNINNTYPISCVATYTKPILIKTMFCIIGIITATITELIGLLLFVMGIIEKIISMAIVAFIFLSVNIIILLYLIHKLSNKN